MEWYCRYQKGEYAGCSEQCPYRSKDKEDGSILTTNAGEIGTWHIDEEIDTRPTAVYGWRDVSVYACDCSDEKLCPVTQIKSAELSQFVDDVKASGEREGWRIWHELYHCIMTRCNPGGRRIPDGVEIKAEYVDEAARRIRQWLDSLRCVRQTS